jgi:hypothetical protein
MLFGDKTDAVEYSEWQQRDWVELEPGTIVVLREHEDLPGYRKYWSTVMDDYVGQQAMIVRRIPDKSVPKQSKLCPIYEVEVLSNHWMYRWRQCSMEVVEGIGVAEVIEPEEKGTEEDIMGKLTKAFGTIKKETVHGAKVASAQEVAEGMVSITKELAGDHYPLQIGETDLGKAAEPWVLAAACIVAADVFEDRLPKAQEVRAVAQLALQGTSKDGAKVFTSKLAPLFERLGALAKDLPAGLLEGAGGGSEAE